jgi:hypothetical protein
MFRNSVIGFAVVLVAACATTNPVPYNPEHLSLDQAKKISQICQDVMGFKSSATLVSNAWPGDPDPAAVTNGHRGCIASLSHSLLTSSTARTESAADQACRADGLAVGSSALAECVLKSVGAASASSGAENVSLVVTPFDDGQERGSWSSETGRREEQACAEVGLDPAGPQFSNCVSGLQDVITAMWLGKDYRN